MTFKPRHEEVNIVVTGNFHHGKLFHEANVLDKKLSRIYSLPMEFGGNKDQSREGKWNGVSYP